jgi:MFS family permease
VQKENYRWVMLAIISLFALGQSLALQSIPPMLSLVIKDFGINHAEAGLSMSLCGLPGVFLILPLSLYLHRIGSKRAGLISIALIVIGTVIVAIAQNLPVFLLGRTIMGIAWVAMPLVGTQGVAQWFAGKRLGLAMGIYTIVFPLSGVITMTSFGAIGIALGWRSVIWLIFGFNVLALVLFKIFFQTPREYSDGPITKAALPFSTLFKIGWPIWALAAMWGFNSICNNVIGTFTPDFLYQSGFDLRVAGSITSIILICGLFIGLLAGYFSDRSRYKEAFIIAGGLIGSIVMFLLPVDIDRVVLYMVLIGVATAPIPPITFAMAATLVKREAMPLAYGAVAACSYAGTFIGPYISGVIRDVSGSYQYSYWFVSLFFILGVVMTLFLLGRRIKLNRAAAAGLKQ